MEHLTYTESTYSSFLERLALSLEKIFANPTCVDFIFIFLFRFGSTFGLGLGWFRFEVSVLLIIKEVKLKRVSLKVLHLGSDSFSNLKIV